MNFSLGVSPLFPFQQALYDRAIMAPLAQTLQILLLFGPPNLSHPDMYIHSFG